MRREASRSIDFSEQRDSLWTRVKVWWWVIFAVPVVVGLLVYLFSSMTPPTYRAQISMDISYDDIDRLTDEGGGLSSLSGYSLVSDGRQMIVSFSGSDSDEILKKLGEFRDIVVAYQKQPLLEGGRYFNTESRIRARLKQVEEAIERIEGLSKQPEDIDDGIRPLVRTFGLEYLRQLAFDLQQRVFDLELEIDRLEAQIQQQAMPKSVERQGRSALESALLSSLSALVFIVTVISLGDFLPGAIPRFANRKPNDRK